MDKEILEKAYQLLARRDHSSQELRSKLFLRYPDTKSIDLVIEKLEALGYLNDAEFAKKYVVYRSSSSPRGYHKLNYELKQRGIKQELIDAALLEASPELQLAKDLLIRKQRRFNSINGQLKTKKIMSLLSSRGFSSETIYKTLESC